MSSQIPADIRQIVKMNSPIPADMLRTVAKPGQTSAAVWEVMVLFLAPQRSNKHRLRGLCIKRRGAKTKSRRKTMQCVQDVTLRRTPQNLEKQPEKPEARKCPGWIGLGLVFRTVFEGVRKPKKTRWQGSPLGVGSSHRLRSQVLARRWQKTQLPK